MKILPPVRIENIAIGDMLVYDVGHNKEYFNVQTIEEHDTEEGGVLILINNTYALGATLRLPMEWELNLFI